MKLDKKHENRLEFIAEGIDTTFANMVRRYSMSRVPVLAISNVTFYDNNSAFWDEYVAHRLGLMPVTTPAKTPEGAEIVLSLDEQGPKIVYTTDFESSDKDISIPKKIIIITLAQDQRLRLEAKATLGTGRKHAKFQAGLVSYGKEGDNIRFMVESFFHMEPYEVIERGCDVITADIEAIEAALGVEKKPKKKAEKSEAKKEKKEKKSKKAEEKKEE